MNLKLTQKLWIELWIVDFPIARRIHRGLLYSTHVSTLWCHIIDLLALIWSLKGANRFQLNERKMSLFKKCSRAYNRWMLIKYLLECKLSVLLSLIADALLKSKIILKCSLQYLSLQLITWHNSNHVFCLHIHFNTSLLFESKWPPYIAHHWTELLVRLLV